MKRIILFFLLVITLFFCNTNSWAGRTWADYFESTSEHVTLSDSKWTDLLSVFIPKTGNLIQINALAGFHARTLNNSTDKIRFDLRFIINGTLTQHWAGPYLTGYMDYTGVVMNTQPASYLLKNNEGGVITVQARYIQVSGQLAKKRQVIKCRKCSLVATEVESDGE